MKFAYILGTSFTELKLFFHKVFIINTLFPSFFEMLCAACIKLFAKASELFMHVMFQLIIICKMVPSDCVLQGVKKMKFEDAKLGL